MAVADKKESKFVSMVVYLHNDSRHIAPFFDTVLGMFRENFEKYEIICVNDASTDDSVEALKRYFEEEETDEKRALWSGSMINIIHMSYFQGLEASMNAVFTLKKLIEVLFPK